MLQTLPIPGRTLFVFLDETGDESYSDPRHRVFGHGGCAVVSDDYQKRIRTPWSKLKIDHLGLSGKPFHAVAFEQSAPSRKQISAINAFLMRNFYRIAVTSDNITARPPKIDAHEMVTLVTWVIIQEIARLHDVDAVMVFMSILSAG